MKLIIDYRESSLINECENIIQNYDKFSDIVLKKENLLLGDICIKDDDNKEIIIFERKTLSDLIASIKDKRYEEQSYRLNGCELFNHNIIYIIEGVIIESSDKNTIYSCMFSLSFYKGFSVMKSNSLNETAYIICNAITKINKEKKKVPFYTNSLNTESNDDTKNEVSYSSLIKKKKNENINVSNFGEIVLCQIPTISNVTAKAILDKFGNLNNLIDNLRLDNNCLDNITYLTSTNQLRKLSKTSIKNVSNFIVNW
jgi:ERCC4-type nuclease